MADEGLDALQTQNYIRLYQPVEWYEVVPVTHILGRLSLVPDFGTMTIPYIMRNKRKACFPKGFSDTAEGKGDGSRLYYVNHFAMTWSRSKLSLFRYAIFPVCVLQFF